MNRILHGDCTERLAEIESETVDLLATDPPYGYGFLGNSWDSDVPTSQAWSECLRCLKPGAFAFVFSSPRADLMSRMITRLGDAGFVTGFTPIFRAFAGGFSKGRNVADVLGPDHELYQRLRGSYTGYHPKAAVDVVIVAMKPLSESTFTAQSCRNGKGVTWLDDVRIPADPADGDGNSSGGRFPANLVVSDDSLNDGREHKSGVVFPHHNITGKKYLYDKYGHRTASDTVCYGDSGSFSRFFDIDKWEAQFIVDSRPTRAEMDAGVTPQSGPLAELCSNEKPDGSGVRNNTHHTVKSIVFMSYLVMMGTRRGDTVLDPFAGSGTTAIAATLLGRDSISIEIEHKNYMMIRERAEYWKNRQYGNISKIKKQDEAESQTDITEWVED